VSVLERASGLRGMTTASLPWQIRHDNKIVRSPKLPEKLHTDQPTPIFGDPGHDSMKALARRR